MRKVKAARRQTGFVRTEAKKRLYVDGTEEIIMNPDALPDELLGWRRYRIEYGGHAERCVLETPIYLPPWVRGETRALAELLEFGTGLSLNSLRIAKTEKDERANRFEHRRGVHRADALPRGGRAARGFCL